MPARAGLFRRAGWSVAQTAATAALDVRLLWRNQFYALTLGLAVVLGLGLRFFFSPEQAGTVLPVVFLLMVGASTYFIAGALVLLEKSQGTLAALRTSPLRPRAYVRAKVLGLSTLLVAECGILTVAGFGGAGVERWWLLGVGLLTLGVLQTAVGVGQVAPHDSVTSFLIPGAALVGTVLQLPVFFVLEVGPPWVWYLIPTHGPFLLILGAWRELTAWQWLYAAGVSVGALALSLRWARRRLDRHLDWTSR
ncbi:MAG: hypothetical protein AAFY88_02645 [Acidobacteriota bacterium]